MLEIRNHTPFQVGLAPSLDPHGVEHATVIVKATFALERGHGVPLVAEQQVALVLADVFFGDPATSSIRYESDYGPTKPATDVVLVGHARSAAPVTSMAVGLAVGPVFKAVRVVGDRAWVRTTGGWLLSEPLPFTTMPLVYERSFGGMDQSHDDPAEHRCEERNLVGRGFCATDAPARVEGLPLPNLEDPYALIAAPTDTPAPAGFGYLGRHWLPRRTYAGTYDDEWLAERCPLLPLDFDERFFNAAHPELVAPGYLEGGEPVRVTGVHEQHELVFDLPRRSLRVTATVKGVRSEHVPRLDTVLIEPDELRLVLVYRATLVCPQSVLLLDDVHVAETGAP